MTSDAVRFQRLAAALALFAAPPPRAGVASALAADPPFPSPAPGQYVYDPDNVLTPQSWRRPRRGRSRRQGQGLALGARRRSGSDVTPEGRQPMRRAVRQWGARRPVVALLTFPSAGRRAQWSTPDLAAARV
jgi:hypothetical protein